MSDYQRILVLGSPGSGKSTVADKLHELTKIPVTRLDQLFWEDNDTTVTISELEKRIEPILLENSWILDGNYDSILQQRLSRADLVIYLNVPRLVCIYRVVKRYFKYRGRENPGGNPDLISWDFLKYIWKFPENQGKAIDSKLANVDNGLRIIRGKNGKYLFKQFLQKE